MKFFKNARNLWEWLEYWGGFIFIRYRLNKYSMDEGVVENREYTGDEVTPKMIKIIEDKMSKDVKERSEKLVRNFQKLHVDPLGIGEQVRMRTRSWDKKKWDEVYTSIPINVNAKVEILESGVVE